MEAGEKSENKFQEASEKRASHVDAITNSNSRKKVVVAGPGTGKTYLFKKALAGKKKTLTLTFVNSLVEDLSLDLCGISDVKTLHGFSRSLLAEIKKVPINIFPKLSKIISEDFEILQGKKIDFEKLFFDRKDDNDNLEFYEKRRNFYNFYGYTDIVFAAVKLLESDRNLIPSFELVVVDEFQDFNMLEVSLIELLAEKNAVLLAGDDDQALYEFKHASANHIRERHGEKMPEYESFNLPFCARCTRVVVEATNDLINEAKKLKLLNKRIDKPYIYFEDERKNIISEKYQKIFWTNKFATQIPWFIEKSIFEIAKDIKEKFSVLIISPFKKQSLAIVELLREKGFANIDYSVKADESDVTLLDGLKIIIENRFDNLGWRIISKFFLNEEEFLKLIKAADANPSKTIYQLMPLEIKKEVLSIRQILKSLATGKAVEFSLLDELYKKINVIPYEYTNNYLIDEIKSTLQNAGNPAIRKIPIKVTTIPSSKGLAADVVFITHFDDRFFIKSEDKKTITDHEICSFLVALTRMKKVVYLISSAGETPTFLKWINKNKIAMVN